MDVYIFQAAMLCEECGHDVRQELDEQGACPADPQDEATYDSGDYPKGTYPDGGGEADSPQHCDRCGLFLENPLTDDGEDYLHETINDDLDNGRTDSVAVREWAPFYGVRIIGLDSVMQGIIDTVES